MEASHHLPLDILRLLFEFSASASLETARTLSLVSKEVQHWTDPCLFRIVQGSAIDHPSPGNYRTSLVDQLCSSDASPRFVLARRYVRAVAWERNVKKKSHLQQALDHFPNLVQICLWKNVFPFRPGLAPSRSEYFEITQGYPSLRRVSTCTWDVSTTPPNAFEFPFWMSITHLQVNYYDTISSSQSPFKLPLFTAMSSLTHLALSVHTAESEPDIGLAFSRLKGTFPPSLILCLLALLVPQEVDPGHWFTEMAYTSLKVDERFVIWSEVPEGNVGEMVISEVGDNFQMWCGVQDGMQTLWELGESVLKCRQKTLHAV